LKVSSLIEEIVKDQIFGKGMGYTYSIEFQKRSLPHIHIFVILDSCDKVYGLFEEVDKIVSAEIPDHLQYESLFYLVKQHMIHGPCGILNPCSPCMKEFESGEAKCSKRFPKQFSGVTNIILSSYPS
jgi:Helitron helicase-like domain at N-terminus